MALLSVVLPAYNEEENISNTVRVLDELLTKEQIDYELIFVSDGSKDRTYEEIQKAAKENAEKNPSLAKTVRDLSATVEKLTALVEMLAAKQA